MLSALFLLYDIFGSYSISLVAFAVSLIVLIAALKTKKGFGNYFVNMYFKETPVNKRIVDQITNNVGPFIPPWWYSPALGTIVPFGRSLNLDYQREVMRDHKKSSFAVDWYPYTCDEFKDSVDKLIVFLPGLGLSSQSKFCKQFVNHMYDNGFITAVLNARGTEIELTSSEVWHPGMYQDCLALLRRISESTTKHKIFLVGFSAGTAIVQNVLLRISRYNKIKNVCAALCICTCHDYMAARAMLESSVEGCVYSFLMTMMHKCHLEKNLHVFEDDKREVVEKILACKFLSEFDRMAVELHGFESEDDYITAVSFTDLQSVKTPLMIMQPMDDPLMQGNFHGLLDINKTTENSNIIIMEPSHGNHFGFYEGSLIEAILGTSATCYTYPAKVAVEFFNSVHPPEN